MKRKSPYWKPDNDIIKIGTGFGDAFRKSLVSSIKVSSKPAFKPHFRLNLDTDRDGVPDHKDCEPFNYWKQHRDSGDWMETEEIQPRIYGHDWMDTRRYKRRPKAENKRDIRNDLANEAIARYHNSYELQQDIINSARSYLSSQMGFLSYQQVVPDKPTHINVRDIKICPFKRNVLIVYDRESGVYHYVDIEEPSKYEPSILFSITEEDKGRFNSRQIKEFVEMDE